MTAIVVGGGPAAVGAMTALRCEGVDALMLAGDGSFRGDLSPAIENIPGAGSVSGANYKRRLYEGLDRFSARYVFEKATSLHMGTNGQLAVSTRYSERYTDAVILATGLTLTGDPRLRPASTNRIIVQGGGDAAVQVALGHAETASKHVTLVVQGKDLGSCSSYLRARLDRSPVEVMFECGADIVDGRVVIRDLRPNGLTWQPKNACLQVLVGAAPDTAWLPNGIAKNDQGHIYADGTFQTTMPRVFACGDVRAGSIKRVAIAQGEGVAAGHYVAAFLRKQEKP